MTTSTGGPIRIIRTPRPITIFTGSTSGCCTIRVRGTITGIGIFTIAKTFASTRREIGIISIHAIVGTSGTIAPGVVIKIPTITVDGATGGIIGGGAFTTGSVTFAAGAGVGAGTVIGTAGAGAGGVLAGATGGGDGVCVRGAVSGVGVFAVVDAFASVRSDVGVVYVFTVVGAGGGGGSAGVVIVDAVTVDGAAGGVVGSGTGASSATGVVGDGGDDGVELGARFGDGFG